MEDKRRNGRRAPAVVQRCEKLRAASAGRQSAAAGVRLFLPAPANSMSLLGCLGLVCTAETRQAGSSDRHASIEPHNE